MHALLITLSLIKKDSHSDKNCYWYMAVREGLSMFFYFFLHFLPIWWPIVPYLIKLPMLVVDMSAKTPLVVRKDPYDPRGRYVFSKPHCLRPCDRNSEANGALLFVAILLSPAESSPCPQRGEPIMPLPCELAKLWRGRESKPGPLCATVTNWCLHQSPLL